MTKALKIRIGNLLFEFLAHTLVFLCTLNSARAVAACPLQALFNCFYYFFVGIKCYFHLLTPQFLRRLPLISSLAYTIYSNLNLVKLRVPRTIFIYIVSAMQTILCPSVKLLLFVQFCRDVHWTPTGNDRKLYPHTKNPNIKKRCSDNFLQQLNFQFLIKNQNQIARTLITPSTAAIFARSSAPAPATSMIV